MSIKITLFGDFVAVEPQRIRMTDAVKTMIQTSDISVCNFEAPIEGSYQEIDREGPKVKQSKGTSQLLKDFGFNVIQLANNHMGDLGENGCVATIKAFEDVVTVGAGTWDEAYRVKVVETKGKRIGFLSCVHHEFGVLENEKDGIGTAWICHDRIIQLICEAKKSGEVDFLIVLPHAGVEMTDAPIPEWREKYRSFIEFGADAVVATHPHVPQGWEMYKEKPICYSLGNFYFDAIRCDHPYWNKSLVAMIEIDETGSIRLNMSNIKCIDGQIGVDNDKETQQHNKEICALLNDSEQYDAYIRKISLDCWKDYQTWMVRGLGAVSFKLGLVESLKSIYCVLFRRRPKTLLMNAMQCESHRWTILRAQKNIKE